MEGADESDAELLAWHEDWLKGLKATEELQKYNAKWHASGFMEPSRRAQWQVDEWVAAQRRSIVSANKLEQVATSSRRGSGLACCLIAEHWMILNDEGEAKTWFSRAAEKDHLDAVVQMIRFEQKAGDENAVFLLLNQAVRLGSAFHKFGLAMFYFNGSGCVKDETKALQLMEEAANSEHGCQGNALLELGKWHYDGILVEKNAEQGVALWTKAANLGNVDAMRNLGRHFVILGLNRGEDQSVQWLERAYDWLSKAADKGDVESALCLKQVQDELLKQTSSTSD